MALYLFELMLGMVRYSKASTKKKMFSIQNPVFSHLIALNATLGIARANKEIYDVCNFRQKFAIMEYF